MYSSLQCYNDFFLDFYHNKNSAAMRNMPHGFHEIRIFFISFQFRHSVKKIPSHQREIKKRNKNK